MRGVRGAITTSYVQKDKRMRRVFLQSVACPAVTYYSTWPHKRGDFGKKLLNIKCVFCCPIWSFSEIFLILSRILPHNVIKFPRPSCKVPLLLSEGKGTGIVLTDFRDTQYGPKVSGVTYKSRSKSKMLWGIYSAIYGEVNVSVENGVEIKGELLQLRSGCMCPAVRVLPRTKSAHTACTKRS